MWALAALIGEGGQLVTAMLNAPAVDPQEIIPELQQQFVERAEYRVERGRGRGSAASKLAASVATDRTSNAASQSRGALSSVGSKTGARSPGEELMTCNAVAVSQRFVARSGLAGVGL